MGSPIKLGKIVLHIAGSYGGINRVNGNTDGQVIQYRFEKILIFFELDGLSCLTGTSIIKSI